ncbi:metal ABC transporter ATP-binding protein [Marinobacterium jannaschii]|uniref:metal ABC transporter ATP-binding protein n=1 Tax=Marinobacterium jannaschii TaxID=64970 RepID=UPI0006851E30|nr:metal ABC transporter ATP-binding protein [Marinobacterium jannaschii]
MGPEIRCHDLSLTLGGNDILQPLSTCLHAGKLHLLIGPNGAGKSSLLKCLLGQQPHQGDISLHWASKADRVSPAYIPQQSVFDVALPVSVSDFLSAGISRWPLFGWKRQRVADEVRKLLLQVGMADKAEYRLDQLSGGERQRVLFARALQHKPGFWCLDEPMTGLDQDAHAQITQLILRQRQQGATIVMVHHDYGFVRQYADQVLLIDNGLVASGSAESVLRRLPTTPVTSAA